MGIRSGFRDFVTGLRILLGRCREGEGDPGLARMARIIETTITGRNKYAVAKQVIKSIEKEMARLAKKGPERVDAEIQKCLDTPDYMHMLKRLDMGEPNLRVMGMEALKRREK